MSLHQTIQLSDIDLNDTLGAILFKRGISPSTITVTLKLPYIADNVCDTIKKPFLNQHCASTTRRILHHESESDSDSDTSITDSSYRSPHYISSASASHDDLFDIKFSNLPKILGSSNSFGSQKETLKDEDEIGTLIDSSSVLTESYEIRSNSNFSTDVQYVSSDDEFLVPDTMISLHQSSITKKKRKFRSLMKLIPMVDKV